jgi:uncharacterized membrane protein YoaK (UPF0700 family)
MLKGLTAKERNKKADIDLGIVLAFIAGAINAGGFLAVGYYTSHMTGVVSSVADYIALSQWQLALTALVFLFSFICGSASTAIIVNWARNRGFSSAFALPLIFEAVLLVVFGLFANMLSIFTVSFIVTIALLCYIMGLQNAIITKISNAEIRTTHVTGLATDIGIECGRIIFSLFGGNVARNQQKLRIHVFLLLAFLFGGICGAVAFNTYGFIATLPFSVVLMVIAYAPVAEDIKRKIYGQ